ncbi:hypothetical protein NL676_032864 [Syzygium grande]|nr:hypothetical protein NL676_032864 [Syzygium grande]
MGREERFWGRRGDSFLIAVKFRVTPVITARETFGGDYEGSSLGSGVSWRIGSRISARGNQSPRQISVSRLRVRELALLHFCVREDQIAAGVLGYNEWGPRGRRRSSKRETEERLQAGNETGIAGGAPTRPRRRGGQGWVHVSVAGVIFKWPAKGGRAYMIRCPSVSGFGWRCWGVAFAA